MREAKLIPTLDKVHMKRFLQKFRPTTTKQCWNWYGHLNLNGYGTFLINGKQFYAHRVSYNTFIGVVPSKLWVCHRCDNPRCVNPNHLFLGTDLDNTNDAHEKRHIGVITSREKFGWIKSKSVVQAIRMAVGSQSSIARRFGVNQSTVSRIKNGVSWAWETD